MRRWDDDDEEGAGGARQASIETSGEEATQREACVVGRGSACSLERRHSTDWSLEKRDCTQAHGGERKRGQTVKRRAN